MISFENVTKSFAGRVVLDGVSLKIKKGETFVIIGLSGTGKTVSLKHMAGLLDPDSGIVMINGNRMDGASPGEKESIRKKMGVVFQSGALLNWMNVWQNVALPLIERRSHSMSRIEEIVDEKLRLLHLDDARDKMPSDISGGMRKRVCLARVLVRSPEIILYDEPTSGLDPVMSNIINELVIKMKAEFGVTSVVVTHDMNSAYKIADRIAMLFNGKIIQCDTPERIMHTDNPVVRQFITGELQGPIEVD